MALLPSKPEEKLDNVSNITDAKKSPDDLYKRLVSLNCDYSLIEFIMEKVGAFGLPSNSTFLGKKIESDLELVEHFAKLLELQGKIESGEVQPKKKAPAKKSSKSYALYVEACQERKEVIKKAQQIWKDTVKEFNEIQEEYRQKINQAKLNYNLAKELPTPEREDYE